MWRVNCWNSFEVTQQQITKTSPLLLKKYNVFPQKSLGYIRYAKLETQPSTLPQGYFSKVCPVFLGWIWPWKIPLSPKLKQLILTMFSGQKSWHMLVSLRLKKKKKVIFSAVKSKSIKSSSMCICKTSVLPMCNMLSGVKYVLQCAHYCIKTWLAAMVWIQQ